MPDYKNFGMEITVNKKEYLNSFIQEIGTFAKENINTPLPEARMEDFYLFKETGNRLIYEGEYFGRRKFLTVYGIVAEYYDMFVRKCDLKISKKVILNKLSYILEEICQEMFWALPAHVDFNNLDECTIDLFAAETAGTLSEMMYLFQDELSFRTVGRVNDEILRRVIKPFCESEFPYSWWETDRCNWSSVCAGSIGMAVIYLDRIGALPRDYKKKCLERVCNSMKCYLDGMEEDGACTEGLGYFSYGMSYFTGFAELYKEDTKKDLMKSDKVHKIATFQQKCYFGNGISISFSDGSQRECFLPGLTAYLKSNYKDVEIPDYSLARGFEADACYRWLSNERNIKWTLKYDMSVNNVETKSNYYLLPSAQWMIVQDENGNGFAAKGGNNLENHNHNDVGHFLCVYNGEMLLTDIGAGEYTKDYFNEGRYGILCNRSLGHSVPLINDKEQLEGAEYKASEFNWNEEAKTLKISFAGAYEKGLIQEINRSISKVEEDKIIISDEFICNDCTEKITESLVTFFEPEIIDGAVAINGKNGSCIIEGFSSKPEIITKDHSLHDGTPTKVYLIHWNLEINKKEKVSEKLTLTFR